MNLPLFFQNLWQLLQRRIILQVSPTINVQICCIRSPAGTSDFQLCICFHSKTPKLQLTFSPAQSSNRYTFHLPYNFFFRCSSLGTCSDLFSSQEWVGFFPSVYSSLHFFLLSRHLSMCQPCSTSSPWWHSELLLLLYTLTILSCFPTCCLSQNTFHPLISKAQMLVRFPWWQQQL